MDIVNSGMDTIGKIAELRKKARKIRIRKRQEQLDYENILRDMETHEKEGDDGKQGSDKKERVGLKNNEGVSLDALHTKLTDSTEEIQSLELELNAVQFEQHMKFTDEFSDVEAATMESFITFVGSVP